MNAKEMLIGARELIADPKHWIKGSYERELAGGVKAYCLIGALSKVRLRGTANGDDDYDIARVAERHLRDCVQRRKIPVGFYGNKYVETAIEFNDLRTTTHADVLAVLDCAIEEAGK